MVGPRSSKPVSTVAPLLSVEALSVVYERDMPSLPTLRDVTFSVQKGEIIAIVGPTGCGKSTLLHAVGAFIGRQRGSIRLNGKEVLSATARIGFVEQRGSLFPWLNVEGNVAFGLQRGDVTSAERQRRVRSLLESVGMLQYAAFYPEVLSGGMQRRVALARAIATEPELLLLDEPFAALDFAAREAMHNVVLELWGRTKPGILMVTHEPTDAVDLADRILVLDSSGALVHDMRVGSPRRQLSAERENLLLSLIEILRSISPTYTNAR